MCCPFHFQTISQIDLQSDFYTIGVGSENMPTSYINPYCDIMNPSDQLPEPEPTTSPPVMMEMQPVPFHTLILDLGGVCFIDLMGIKVLTKVNKQGIKHKRMYCYRKIINGEVDPKLIIFQ